MLGILHLVLLGATVAVSEMFIAFCPLDCAVTVIARSIRIVGWVVRTLYEQGANPTVDGSQGDRAKVPGIEAPGTEGTDDP